MAWSRSDVFARRYDASDRPLGSLFQVSTSASASLDANVAVPANGSFAVAWSSGNPVQDGADGSGGGVFARLYSKDGGPLGTEVALNAYTTGSQLQPAIAFADADTVVVAWSSEAQDGSDAGIVARRSTRSAPVCGDATGDGVTTAADALAALKAATGAEACAACLCDSDMSGKITASDALRILSSAVGQPATLACEQC